ncbi:MAG: M4 family metallopeptidase [Bacteroidales bacterium]|nr:M4 family metallopeptidase [Bacteroidales bacterium]
MKKIIKYFFLVVLFLGINFLSFGQYIPRVLQPDNQEIQNLSERISKNGWVYFKKNLDIKPDEVFTKYPSAFGLLKDDEMRLWKSSKDESGNLHYRYTQYFKGIPVEGTEYIVHAEQEIVRLCHGSIVESLDIAIKPNIDEETALKLALEIIGAEKYAWEDQDWEQFRKVDLKDSSATWFPKGELVITRIPGKSEYIPENYQLAYKFLVRTLSPDDNINIYINAKTGELINKFSNVLRATGTVVTVYNGTRSFYTYYRGFPNWDFILEDRTKPSDVDTRNHQYKDGYPWCIPKDFWNMTKIDDNNNYWNIDDDKHAATSHWAAQNAYKVFKDYFGRNNGIREASGYEIRVVNNYSNFEYEYTLSFNPGGGGDYIQIGQALGTYSDDDRYEGSLDAIGHEFTHGVSLFSAGLSSSAYGYESGALMESFSDIFGEVIEYYTLGNNDWIMGTNLINEVKRSLQNPHLYDAYISTEIYNDGCNITGFDFDYLQEYPISYHDNNWYPYNNSIGAHINLSVQNKWFYLLANGGTQNGVTVSGIGIYKAARITYTNLVDNIGIGSTYPTAREGTIDVAETLYGECSPEYISTMNAWAAVNVGDPAPDPCDPPDPPLNVYITGPTKLNMGQPGTWYAHPSGGTGSYSYEWYVDFGWGWGGPYGTQSYYTTMMPDVEAMNLRVDVTSGYQQASDQHLVICLDCFGPMKSMKVDIFPNPAKDILNVTIDEEERIKNINLSGEKVNSSNNDKNDYSGDIIYTLYNIYGQVVYNRSTREKTIKINTSGLQKGHYVLKIISNDSVVSKQIMIK